MHLFAPISFALALSGPTFAAPLQESEDLSIVAHEAASGLELLDPSVGLVKRAGFSGWRCGSQPGKYRCSDVIFLGTAG